MSLKTTKVSIVTIVRNSVLEFEQTIRSVLSQNYPDIECIVIDGVSTDGTLEAIRTHTEHIAYWISEPDKGIYDAMNKGLSKASGEWVNFMNAGDVFCNTQTLSKIFSRDFQDADVIYGDSIACYPSFKAYRKASSPEGLWKGMVCCHQAMFFRTDVIKPEGYKPEYYFSADYELILRLFHARKKFRYVPETFAVFNTRGISNLNMHKSARSNFEILCSYRTLTLKEKQFHRRSIYLSRFTEWVYRLMPSAVICSFLKWRYRMQIIPEQEHQ